VRDGVFLTIAAAGYISCSSTHFKVRVRCDARWRTLWNSLMVLNRLPLTEVGWPGRHHIIDLWRAARDVNIQSILDGWMDSWLAR
jgi:hypothetical protein